MSGRDGEESAGEGAREAAGAVVPPGMGTVHRSAILGHVLGGASGGVGEKHDPGRPAVRCGSGGRRRDGLVGRRCTHGRSVTGNVPCQDENGPIRSPGGRRRRERRLRARASRAGEHSGRGATGKHVHLEESDLGDVSRGGERAQPAVSVSKHLPAEILAEHNRNAERVQVIEARPVLTLTVSDRPNRCRSAILSTASWRWNDRGTSSSTSRTRPPRSPTSVSNDTEYWFWVRDKKQKALYYGNYGEASKSPVAVSFESDWTNEAMGLRVIPEAEVAEISVEPCEPDARPVPPTLTSRGARRIAE